MINFFESFPQTVEIKSKPKFRVEVVTEPDELISHEIKRVQYYLSRLGEYQRRGYGGILRFPAGIDLGEPSVVQVDILQDIIAREFNQNRELYSQFCKVLTMANDQLQICVPEVERLYGYELTGDYLIAPTAYGTNGSSAAYGAEGPVVFRIPTFRTPNLDSGFTTGEYRSPIEMLTHEILAHKATAEIREGTALDEYVEKATHQWHKEYLMDRLGQTILTRSGLMHMDDVAMQVRAMRIAQEDIDPLYFGAEGNLSWEGDLRSLVQRIDRILKGEE